MGEILSAIGANINALHVILFAAGIICLVVEMFQPGFGIFGGSGVLLMLIDVVILADNLSQAAVLFSGVALIVLFFVLLFFILASNGVLPKKLVLGDDKDDAPVAPSQLLASFGDIGTTVTRLCPSGKVEIEGRILDVISAGEFLEPGETVKVVEVSGNRIVVSRA